ncbi:MAG: hypothetical protein LUD02_03640 [Tannerellaceae bacterium]|nr:hypothetical protein [Tannerellaceae bacterium]
MKSNKIFPFVLITFLCVLQGCSVTQHVGQAYTMTQCKYQYDSISQLTLAGINLSKGVSPAAVPKIMALLGGNNSSLPLSLTVNLGVTNPNNNPAALSGLDYILQIDHVEFTRGALNQPLNIAANSTGFLPLAISFDLATLLSGDSKNAVENIVKNFIGVGNEKSNVTLQIKPSLRVGNKTIPAPQYIPVSFSFGGGK